MTLRGEARLGPVCVDWAVPDGLLEAAGGLDALAADPGGLPVTWRVERGPSAPRPARHDAFYGPSLVVAHAAEIRVWSPRADLRTTAGGVSGYASEPCALEASLALHALAAHAGLAHVHAALVRLDGRTILAPGGTGAGKTSTALAVGRHGGELLADDAVYVDSDGVAWPVRRPPHVTDTTLRAHPGIEVLGPVRDGALAKNRIRAPIAEPAAPRSIDAIILPSIDPLGFTRVERVEPAVVFPALVGTSALLPLDGLPRREELLDILATLAAVPAARLLAGPDALLDPARIPAVLSAWLHRG